MRPRDDSQQSLSCGIVKKSLRGDVGKVRSNNVVGDGDSDHSCYGHHQQPLQGAEEVAACQVEKDVAPSEGE